MRLSEPDKWMRYALTEAEKAAALGEVPVGAVIVADGKIISRAHNEVEIRQDATAHAEMLAINRASETAGSWRLTDCSLVVTLEPCSMCIGACLLARIPEVYFGCYDPVQGAVGSVFDLSRLPGLPHEVNVYPGVLAEECNLLLKGFFSKKRTGQTWPKHQRDAD